MSEKGDARPQRLIALKVGNFKAFAETQRVPLRPITLVYGPNSAGKSSLVQALALAHEAEFGSSASRPNIDVHQTRVGGSAIDLGGFRQYVHRGQANRRVEWGAELDVSSMHRTGLDPRRRLSSLASVSLNISLGVEVDDLDRPRPSAVPQVAAMQIVGDDRELLRMSRRPPEDREDRRVGRFRIDRLETQHPVFAEYLARTAEAARSIHDDHEPYSDALAALVPSILVGTGRFLPTDAEVSFDARSTSSDRSGEPDWLRHALGSIVEELLVTVSLAVQAEIGSLNYLGPLRSLPPRHLALADQGDPNRMAGGAYAWDEVRTNDAVRESVNEWLGSTRLKTRYSLVARSLVPVDSMRQVLEDELADDQYSYDQPDNDEPDWPEVGDPGPDDVSSDRDSPARLAQRLTDAITRSGTERFRELVLVDQLRNTVVTHRDVGVGISQVLPVLVMAYASRHAMLAMEQPEIHLHPGLQAELGDVFIESALGSRRNMLLVETHSEHLLLRIMRRIRETHEGRLPHGLTPITAADVSVLYVEPVERRSIVREMPLTPMGDLAKSWPGGFFEEGLREQFDDA